MVLNGITLTIEEGKTNCIIGKSGCGKSVLIKIIVGLLQPDEGSVQVDGKIVSNLSQTDLFALRRKMGFVFQGAALFDSMTVYENIILSEYEHGQQDETYLVDEAKRVLAAVGLLPDVDSPIFDAEWAILKDKKPSDLSGGMRKRVGVARALVGSPDYIFYDEPTTGLDPVTSEQIDDLIDKLAKKFKVTTVVITHDIFSVYKIADQVAMISDGILQFQGSPEQLRQSKDNKIIEFLDRYKQLC